LRIEKGDEHMELSKYIDHTVLKPEATVADIEKLCAEAAKYRFAAVCVNPTFVSRAAKLLSNSGVEVATVVGFPLGANTTAIKVRETEIAIGEGATEIDMVMAIGLFKSGDFAEVGRDIAEVVRVAKNRAVKVILETCFLSPTEIADASRIALEAKAAFVKTSTGFGSRGASVEDIKIMKSVVGNCCQIKASGGIRTKEAALAMIEAGATRIGTSSGIAIVS
jgi:deoxyribose-phosphate aldolase